MVQPIEDEIDWDGDPSDFDYGKMVDKHNELKKAHDNLVIQLNTVNNLLEIAVEALQYYSRNDDKFINWRAKKALDIIFTTSSAILRKSPLD